MKISKPSTSHLLLYPGLPIIKIIGESCLVNSRIKMTISIKSIEENFLDIQLNSREWHSSNTDCVSMNRGRKYIIMSFQEID